MLKMKLNFSFIFLIILISNYCFCFAISTTTKENVIILKDSVETYGTIEKSTSDEMVFSFNLTKETATNITVTPCFGTFEIYVDIDEILINKSESYYYGEWDPNLRSLGTNIKVLPEGTMIYISIKAIDDFIFNGKNVASSFSVLVSTNEDELVIPFLPIPARDGSVDVKITNGGKSGTISFYKTGNSLDTYSIYTYYGFRPNGSFPHSACGIKYYASINKQRIEDNGDNEASATFTALNTKEPTGVTIVVYRKTKNFSNAYNYAVFNDQNSSNFLKSTILNLFPAFFICIFISFLLF